MCGICGILGETQDGRVVDRMLEEMQHRGPDGIGRWESESIILGHRRLAIVDLSDRGRQPMTTSDGRFTAVVNGEIYNYPDLRATLEKEGAVFSSDCDSEVVLHAYRAWGRDSFERLNGMFAFALWDEQEKRLFLVRDRLGIKPLYYFRNDKFLVFASEIRAMIRGFDVKSWTINPRGLDQYLRFQNMIGAETLFSGIRMVEPGHAVEATGNDSCTAPYWAPAISEHTQPAFEDAVEAFKGTFSESVDRHLMSDVPVATYLSAGFDSSMVTVRAAKVLPNAPQAFTGTFDEAGWYDELSGARLVGDKVGTPVTGVRIGADDMKAHFDDMVFALDEPRMGMGAFPQYLVAREAARTHKLILTGHGGDELFAGYPVFKLAYLADVLSRDAKRVSSVVRNIAFSELPHLAYFAGRRAFDRGAWFMPELFSDQQKLDALSPDAYEAVVGSRSESMLDALVQDSESAFDRVFLNYLRIYLPGLLVVEDKISMAHSLESRTPFLDNKLIDLSSRISPGVKLHDGELKAIVRQAARPLLPAALFEMPKRGFPTPMRQWLRGPLASWMCDRLCGSETRLLRLFNRSYLERTVTGYLDSWRRNIRPLDEIPTHRIWMLLSLESWLRQYEERLGVTLQLDGSA